MKTTKLSFLSLTLLTVGFNLFLDNQYLYCEEVKPPVEQSKTVTVNTPTEELFKQNYIDLTNWVKATSTVVGSKTGDLINKTGEFAKEQTPLFIQDFIRWQIWGNLISFFLFAGLLAWSIYLLFLNIDKENCKTSEENNIEAWDNFSPEILKVILFSITTFIFTLRFFICEIDHLENGVKALLAPRVVVVEKIAELIKK